MKGSLLACLILLAALQSQALVMGPSPEASFAGTWRIVNARPAPWIKPHMLSHEEAPLLQFALAFRDGEVLGAPPLACGHAGYRSMSMTAKELFQGHAPESREDEAVQALRLSGPCPVVLRVACDTGTFHFAMAEGNLLFVLDNVVYTMQRAKQDTPPGFSGPSFDCAKARTAGEKAICRDEDLSKFDRQMSAAYTQLNKTETQESFATVQAAQRAWLAFTTKLCDSKGPDQLESCLKDQYGDRAERIDHVGVIEAGTLRLEPRMRFLSRQKPIIQESDSYPWMTGGPQAAAFNTYVAKTLEINKRRMDDKQLLPFKNLPKDMVLSLQRNYSVIRFDTMIASFQVLTFDFTGGAHEVIGEFSVNWDVERGKQIGLNDIFAKDKDWKDFVVDFCTEELTNQFDNKNSEPDRQAVEEVVRDGRNWLFDKGKAVMHFTVYTVTSFSGGEHDVEIPYEKLKPYMRPDAPVLLKP